MAFEEIIKDKQAFVLGFDDVIYPQKDYLLQVYYLFSEFMAYSEQVDAKEILAFMKVAYEKEGAINLFDKTAKAFNLPEKYRTNFALLHQNARLPLKLLLYKQLLALLQEIVVERKTIFLLVDGDPAEQLNKIKQVEWNGLEQYLKLYFTAEFEAKPAIDSINYILSSHKLNTDEVLIVGSTNTDEKFAQNAGIKYFNVTKLI